MISSTSSTRRLPVLLLLLAMGGALVACAGEAPVEVKATPTASATAPTPTSSPTPDGSTGPVTSGDPVSFVYDCYVGMPDEDDPMGTTAPFATWEEVWADPSITACEATQSGTVVTPEQAHAVDLGIDAYAGDRSAALRGLHVQCAITDNGYLGLSTFSGNQISDVEGMLALCPDRPGAAQLRASLAAS